MLTAIAIVREQKDTQSAVYRARRGNRQATGTTPGQALDMLERQLATQGETEKDGLTFVIVQRFGPDEFFNAEQQARLQALMQHWREARARHETLAPAEQEELEQLVKAEWEAANRRAATILRQTPGVRPIVPPANDPSPSST